MAVRELSDAEWRVMKEVWRRREATARTVREALVGETRWAYTTVKTMLDRLVEKGVLRADRRGLARVYSPVLSRSEARRHAAESLLERAFDGAAGPLMHFLVESESLSPEEREELRQMLDEHRRERGGGEP